MRNDGRWQAERGNGDDGRTGSSQKAKSIWLKRYEVEELVVCKSPVGSGEEVAHDWQMRVGCYGRGSGAGGLEGGRAR